MNIQLIDFYSKYIKYKHKYTNLKNQIGGIITEEGNKIDDEFIRSNKLLLNHAIQIFGIDFIAEKINLFNQHYVINEPIISIGSGHGLLEAYIYKNYNINFYAIEPVVNPQENQYIPTRLFFWTPESHDNSAAKVYKKLQPQQKKGRSLLLNWCYPDLDYDYDYIQRFNPYSIFSISGESLSTESVENRNYLYEIINYLLIKNIKYDRLKIIIDNYFTDNSNFQTELDNRENYDLYESSETIHQILDNIKQSFIDELESSEEINEQIKKSYDILFYFNKYLLYWIYENQKLFESYHRDKSINLNFNLDKPAKEFVDREYNSRAGGKEFNKFLQKIKTGEILDYKIITSYRINFNFILRGAIANDNYISFIINLIINTQMTKGKEFIIDPSVNIERNIETTIENIMYRYLIALNRDLLLKINNISKKFNLDKKFKDLTLFPKLHQKIFELENVCDNIFLYFYDYSDTENKYILKTDDVGYSNIIIKLEENLYHSLLNLQI